MASRLSNQVDFPVYQEQVPNKIWSQMMGGKDDMLVFDRCGQLTFHIRLPYSYLKYPYVEATIKATYNGLDSCNCGQVEEEEEVEVEEEVIGTTEMLITEFVTETPESTTIIATEAADKAIDVVLDRDDALIEKHSAHRRVKQRE